MKEVLMVHLIRPMMQESLAKYHSFLKMVEKWTIQPVVALRRCHVVLACQHSEALGLWVSALVVDSLAPLLGVPQARHPVVACHRGVAHHSGCHSVVDHQVH
jgi:hypothetical protein